MVFWNEEESMVKAQSRDSWKQLQKQRSTGARRNTGGHDEQEGGDDGGAAAAAMNKDRNLQHSEKAWASGRQKERGTCRRYSEMSLLQSARSYSQPTVESRRAETKIT